MPEINWDYSLEDTVYGTILVKAKERIVAASLPSIATGRVQIRKLAWPDAPDTTGDDALLPPCIIVSPRPEIVNWRDGTNERDDVVYAFMVSMVLANGRDLTTKGIGLQLAWRQTIRRLFHNKSLNTWSLTLPTGCSFTQSYVESGDQFIEQPKRMQYDAQYWLVRVKVREPRT